MTFVASAVPFAAVQIWIGYKQILCHNLGDDRGVRNLHRGNLCYGAIVRDGLCFIRGGLADEWFASAERCEDCLRTSRGHTAPKHFSFFLTWNALFCIFRAVFFKEKVRKHHFSLSYNFISIFQWKRFSSICFNLIFSLHLLQSNFWFSIMKIVATGMLGGKCNLVKKITVEQMIFWGWLYWINHIRDTGIIWP